MGRLLETRFVDRRTNRPVEASYWIVFQYLLQHNHWIVCLFIMCSVMGFVLTLFWGYHMFLASINQTTNERFKYDTFNAKNKARQMLREELENMGGEQNGDLIGREEKEREKKSSKSKKKKK